MSGADFCRFCGAGIPHRDGEGRCPHCQHHATLFYQEQARRLRAELSTSKRRTDGLCEDEGCPHHGTEHVCVPPAPRHTCEYSDDGKHECAHCDEKWVAQRRSDDMGNWPDDWSCP